MRQRVKVDEIDFPKTLGGGNEVSEEISSLAYGCKVINDLINEKVVTEEELWFDNMLVYRIISCANKEQCSEWCKNMAKIMKSGQYTEEKEEEPIKIFKEANNELYIPGEGKHRVCCAKKFGVKTIPVIIEKL